MAGLLVSELLRTTFSQIKIRIDRFSAGKGLRHQFCIGAVLALVSLGVLSECIYPDTVGQMFNCETSSSRGWDGGGGDVNQRSKRRCLLQCLYEPGQLCLTPCTELLSEEGRERRGVRRTPRH